MNTTKSEQIKAGLRKSFQTGESAKASTVCYGYKVTSEGKLVAYPTEAIIVFHIFERFADGDSLGKIAASLARMKVKSPTGKELWTRETISKILSNEKYVGDRKNAGAKWRAGQDGRSHFSDSHKWSS